MHSPSHHHGHRMRVHGAVKYRVQQDWNFPTPLTRGQHTPHIHSGHNGEAYILGGQIRGRMGKNGETKKVVVCGWLVGNAQHLHLCFWPTLVACGHNYTRLHWREHTTKRTVPAIDTSGTHPLRNSKYVN